MKSEKIVKMVVDRYEASAWARQDREERWKRWYEIYRSRATPRGDGKANLFVPQVFSIIETIMPRLAAGYIATSEPPVSVVGREEQDHKNAEILRTLLTYQFEQAKMPLFLLNFFKQSLIYGTSVAKIYWEFNGISEGPRIDTIDIFDFFIDPDATGLDDARYCIHRKMISLEELKTRGKEGIYNNVSKVQWGQGTDDNVNPALNRNNEMIYDDSISRDVEILEYWEDDRVITIANKSVLLRDTPNPFAHGKKPFVNILFVPVPFEFYGIGVIEPLEGLQMELNTKRNQRLDNVNLILNQMWLIQQGAIDDLRQLKSRPGGIIIVNDINGIRPLPVVDITSHSAVEEERILRDIQNTSGVNDYVKGLNFAGGSKKMTATEARIRAEQSASRLDFNFKLMAEMGIKSIANMIINLNQQFIKRGKIIRVIGPEGVKFQEIDPAQIAGNFDIRVNPDPIGLGEETRLQNIMGALGIVREIPGANPLPIAEKALKKMDVNDDEIARIFSSPAENI